MSSFLLRNVLLGCVRNSRKYKTGIKFFSSRGEVWVMAKLSKQTCCKGMGLLGHLLNLGFHSHPCCAKWLWVWERSIGITALQRARDPTSVKESPHDQLRQGFTAYVYRLRILCQVLGWQPISVCLYNLIASTIVQMKKLKFGIHFDLLLLFSKALCL